MTTLTEKEAAGRWQAIVDPEVTMRPGFVQNRRAQVKIGRDFINLTGTSKNFDEAAATAHMLAAAPEMYEALKALVAMWEDAMENGHPEWVRGESDLEIRPDGLYKLSHARAALAKAEGKAP